MQAILSKVILFNPDALVKFSPSNDNIPKNFSTFPKSRVDNVTAAQYLTSERLRYSDVSERNGARL